MQTSASWASSGGRERAMEEARSIYAEAVTLDDCADSESSSRWK
jgi:hypothetical protein